MRYLTLALSLGFALIIGVAHAQFGPAVYVAQAGGGGGATRPLDRVSGALVAIGMRALSATYADGAHVGFNIIRVSDNDTCDVLFNTSGFPINVKKDASNFASCGTGSTTAVSWCNATSCYIQTPVNQVDGTNLTTLLHVVAFNPSATTSAISAQWSFAHGSAYCTASTVSNPQIVSVSAVYKANAGAYRTVASWDQASPQYSQVGASGASANKAFIYGGTVQSGPSTDAAMHAMAFILNNGGTSHIYTDATDETLSPGGSPGAGSGGTAKICIGAAPDDSNFYDGLFQEAIVWPNASAASFASNVSALSSEQHTAWGF